MVKYSQDLGYHEESVIPMKEKTNYYTIGEMANMCDISPKTLRYYDQISLIKPALKCQETGYRYYSKEQAFTIYIIKKLQQLDFSLGEIKTMLSTDDIDTYHRHISNKITCLDRQIDKLKKIRAEGAILLNKIDNNSTFQEMINLKDKDISSLVGDGSIHLEDIQPQKYFFTSNKTKNYNNFEISIERWLEIFKLAETSKYTVTGNLVLRYMTDQVMDQFYKPQIELELCLPIDAPEPVDNDSHVKELGAFKAVVAYHYGPYESIYTSHLHILRWIENHNYKVTAPVLEEYVISPFDRQANKNFLTKIMYPVEKI